MGPKPKDITGQRFGSLVALRFFDRRGEHARWIFRCDCGLELPVFKGHVTGGHVSQCTDCGRKVQAKKITKHGACWTIEYQIYHAAKDRCVNPNSQRYAQYGGRGIRFEFSSFEHFLAVMGKRPNSNFSLDRIDNDGPYSPSNCRWTTWAEQFKSRRPWNWKRKKPA